MFASSTVSVYTISLYDTCILILNRTDTSLNKYFLLKLEQLNFLLLGHNGEDLSICLHTFRILIPITDSTSQKKPSQHNTLLDWLLKENITKGLIWARKYSINLQVLSKTKLLF